jgi:hypothetical protein
VASATNCPAPPAFDISPTGQLFYSLKSPQRLILQYTALGIFLIMEVAKVMIACLRRKKIKQVTSDLTIYV